MGLRRLLPLIVPTLYLVIGCGPYRDTRTKSQTFIDQTGDISLEQQLQQYPENFKTAWSLMSGYDTGKQVLNEISSKNIYNEPIEIRPIHKKEMEHFLNFIGGGTTKDVETGRYVILVDFSLDPPGIAHALTTGIELARMSMQEDDYLKDKPNADKMINAAKDFYFNKTNKTNPFTNFYDPSSSQSGQLANQQGAMAFLKSLFFMMVKANDRSDKLESENLKFNRPLLKQLGIANYIAEYHFKLHGAKLDQPADQLYRSVQNTKSLIDFQRDKIPTN